MLTTTTPEQLQAVVYGKIRAVLQERFGQVRPFEGTDKLNAALGLSSLDLAFVVADLEIELGVDPFARLVSITSVRTVDDLVEAYRAALFGDRQPQVAANDVEAAMQRANSRRSRKARR